MVALLRDYYDFGHEPAEVLGVVRQMVKLWGVKEIGPGGNPGAIQNHIHGLAAAQSDGVGLDVKIVPGLVTQKLSVEAHHEHGDAYGRQRLVFRDVEVGNTQCRLLAASSSGTTRPRRTARSAWHD